MPIITYSIKIAKVWKLKQKACWHVCSQRRILIPIPAAVMYIVLFIDLKYFPVDQLVNND